MSDENQTHDESEAATPSVTLESVRHDLEVRQFVRKADENLAVLGYTEHGPRHAGLVADIAQNVLLRLGHPRREAELAAVAGYLHDIGNGISRLDHGIAAALIAQRVLERLGMPPEEIVEVMCAIGNHEEEYGEPVSALAAAVILADKSDVHRSRVRVIDPDTDDIHDRVNTATQRSFLVGRRARQDDHAADGDRHRADPPHGVLRDLPRAHGDVPQGGRVARLQVRSRHQRHAAAVDALGGPCRRTRPGGSCGAFACCTIGD